MFFDLHECGTATLDEEGRELASLAEARQMAIADARAVMCDEVSKGRLCLSCCIKIRDDGGRILETIPFTDALTVSGLSPS